MADWYIGSTKWTAVTAWAATTAYVVGDLRRQLAAVTAGNERVFRCTTAGTSGGTEPAWVLTTGATTNDGTAVWTEVTGNATYNWAAPYARLETAVLASRAAAGDRFFVSHSHAQTTATTFTITPCGTVTAPILVYCVLDTGSVPPVAADLRTTATITTTSIAGITIAAGVMYMYGVTINNGGSSNNLNIGQMTADSQNSILTFENCGLRVTNTTATRRINFGKGSGTFRSNSALKITLINTTLEFADVAQAATFSGCDFLWRNTSGAAVAGTLPTSLFQIGGSTFDDPAFIRLEGLDLSAFSAGKTLFAANQTNTRALLLNCKIDASVTVAATPTAPGGAVDLLCSDSTSSTDRAERYQYQGTQTRESTIIRTGGASNGVAGSSWKVVTNANNEKEFPFECLELAAFNPTSGSAITVTVELVNDGVTLKDDEVWMLVEYLGTAGNPIASVVSTGRATPLTAGANIATSTATWTTTGLASPVKQKLVATFTPQLKGLVRCRVFVGKTSQTVYIDPKVTIT